MKKLLVGLFMFSFLFVGFQIYAEDTPVAPIPIPEELVCCESFGYGANMVKTNSSYEITIKNKCSTCVLDMTTGLSKCIAGGGRNIVDNSFCKTAIVAPIKITCPLNMPNPYALCSDGKIEPATRDANQCVTSYKCTTPQITPVAPIQEGCLFGYVYNTKTGEKCSAVSDDTGCKVGFNFSSITGKACPVVVPTASTTQVVLTTVSTTDGSSVQVVPIKRTLRRGVVGDDVKTLQEFLGIKADGVYGSGTVTKVMEWQTQNGLTPDGAFGNMSRQEAGL